MFCCQVWTESLESDAESIAKTAGDTLIISGDVSGGDRDDDDEGGDRPMLGSETTTSLSYVCQTNKTKQKYTFDNKTLNLQQQHVLQTTIHILELSLARAVELFIDFKTPNLRFSRAIHHHEDARGRSSVTKCSVQIQSPPQTSPILLTAEL